MDNDADSQSQGRTRDRSELAVTRIAAAQRPLYAYIQSLVVSPDDVEDILQEVNLVLWRKAGEFEGRGSFLSWACHIAYLQVLAHCKREKRGRHAVLDEAGLADVARSMAGKVERVDERIESLRRCLAKLAPRQRQMILRRYEVGGSIQAVAAEFDRPVASVRVALHRIRLTILECIGRTLQAGGGL